MSKRLIISTFISMLFVASVLFLYICGGFTQTTFTTQSSSDKAAIGESFRLPWQPAEKFVHVFNDGEVSESFTNKSLPIPEQIATYLVGSILCGGFAFLLFLLFRLFRKLTKKLKRFYFPPMQNKRLINNKVLITLLVLFVFLIVPIFSMGAYWVQNVGLLPGSAVVFASDAPAIDRYCATVFKHLYGDRVGVCDGVADDVQILAAIAAGALDILVIGSTINTTSSLNLTTSGLRLRIPTAVITYTGAGSAIIIGGNGTECINFEFYRLLGKVDNTSAVGIDLRGGQSHQITGNRIGSALGPAANNFVRGIYWSAANAAANLTTLRVAIKAVIGGDYGLDLEADNTYTCEGNIFDINAILGQNTRCAKIGTNGTTGKVFWNKFIMGLDSQNITPRALDVFDTPNDFNCHSITTGFSDATVVNFGTIGNILSSPDNFTISGLNGNTILSPHFRKMVRKSADETVNNSTVLQNDDELFFTVGANENWVITLNLKIVIDPAADLKLAFTVPAGGDINASDNAAGNQDLQSLTGMGIATSGNYARILIHIYYAGGANAGTIQMQWSQNSAHVSDSKVLSDSILIAERIK